MKKLLLSAACGAALCGGVAVAQDESTSPLSFSGSVALTSNYMFRGVTQSLDDPEGQLNLRLDHESGFYVGAFGSGVNFGDGETDLEVDLFAGYAFALDESLTLDISAIWYTYPGAVDGSSYDYFEGFVALTYAASDDFSLNVKAAASPEFFGESGTAFWAGAGASVVITDWLSASGNIGYQWVEDNAVFLLPDYFHYDVGATLTFSVFALDIRYIGTDLPGDDEEIVGTLSVAF